MNNSEPEDVFASVRTVMIVSGEKKEKISFFSNMDRGTMMGSNERVNYICMNDRFFFLF